MFALDAVQLRDIAQYDWRAQGRDHQGTVVRILNQLQAQLDGRNFGFTDLIVDHDTVRFYARAWESLFIAEQPAVMHRCCELARRVYELFTVGASARRVAVTPLGSLYERRAAAGVSLPIELWNSFTAAATEVFRRREVAIHMGLHVTMVPRGVRRLDPHLAHRIPRQLIMLYSIHVERRIFRPRPLNQHDVTQLPSAAAAA